MIARVWRGWTSEANSGAYEAIYKNSVLPHLARVPGYIGAELLRRVSDREVEFISITYFESLDAIRSFAGSDFELAVVTPPARRVLSRFEERCQHYDVLVAPAISNLTQALSGQR